jgi:hypothetical protein
MARPSFVLMIYYLAFCFGDPESASCQAFMGRSIALLIPVIIDNFVEIIQRLTESTQ